MQAASSALTPANAGPGAAEAAPLCRAPNGTPANETSEPASITWCGRAEAPGTSQAATAAPAPTMKGKQEVFSR
jgi:hypothetical protein